VALSSATGILQIGTGTAGTVYSVTGLSFQPKIVFFAMSGNTVIGTAARGSINGLWGVAVGTTTRRCVAIQSTDAAGTMETDAIERDDACIATLTHAGTGAVDGLADFNGFTSDGFGVIVDDQFSQVEEVWYWALGGSDIDQIATGVLTEPGATGTQSVTGLGFQPTVVNLFSCDATSVNTAASDASLMIGFMTSAAEGVIANKSDDARGTATTNHYARDNEVVAGFEASAASPGGTLVIDMRASSGGMTVNGFDLSWTERTARARRIPWVAWNGSASWKLGSDTMPNGMTVSSTRDVTGVGFEPGHGLILMTRDVESTADTAQGHAALSIGAFVGTGTQKCVAWIDETGGGAAECTTVTDDNDLAFYMPLGGGPNRFRITAIGSDGFTLTHDTGAAALGTAAFYLYLVAEGAGSSPQSVTPGPAIAEWVVPTVTPTIAATVTTEAAVAIWHVPQVAVVADRGPRILIEYFRESDSTWRAWGVYPDGTGGPILPLGVTGTILGPGLLAIESDALGVRKCRAVTIGGDGVTDYKIGSFAVMGIGNSTFHPPPTSTTPPANPSNLLADWDPNESLAGGQTLVDRTGTYDMTLGGTSGSEVVDPQWVAGGYLSHTFKGAINWTYTRRSPFVQLQSSAAIGVFKFTNPLAADTGNLFLFGMCGLVGGFSAHDRDCWTHASDYLIRIKIGPTTGLPGSGAIVTSTTAITNGAEMTIGYSHDHVAETLTIYINGIAESTVSCTGTGNLYSATPRFLLGRTHETIEFGFKRTRIGRFLHYSGPRSAAGMAADHAMLRAQYPGLP
jgi:hypothetical protein